MKKEKEQKPAIDSYKKFFNDFEIDYKKFLEWGVKEAIFLLPDKDAKEEKKCVKLMWRSLIYKLFGEEIYKQFFSEDTDIKIEDIKKYIEEDDKRAKEKGIVYIRSSGRQGASTEAVIKEYEKLGMIKAVLKKDSTNNNRPTRMLKKTGYHKDGDRNIHNYVVAHIWGETQNPLLFECPWNICYLPKIVDPFSGHESTEETCDEGVDNDTKSRKDMFQSKLQEKAYGLFEELVIEYNKIRDVVIAKINKMEDSEHKQLLERAWRKIEIHC